MTAIAKSAPLDQVCMGAPVKSQVPVVAAKKLYMGQMVALLTASGFATDPSSATTGAVLGVAEADADNTAVGAANGDVSCNILEGLFWRPAYATNPPDATHVGKVVYAKDNYTISYSAGDGPVAGVLYALDAEYGCLVYISGENNYLLSQATLASELGSVANGEGASMVAIEDAGTFTAETDVEAALAEIYQGLLSAQKTVLLPLTSAIDIATGALLAVFAGGASTTPGTEFTNSKTAAVRWNNDAAPGAIALNTVLPQDIDDTQAVVVHALVSKTGATLGDATKLTVGAFFHTVGALHDADVDAGGDTGAVVGDATAKTVSELTFSIAAGDVPAAPCGLCLTVKPKAGTLGTDDFVLHELWLEYTPKLLAS